MDNDNITGTDPRNTMISLDADALIEVTGTYTQTLGGETAPKNSGAVIPNITNGFTGTSPDRGALISGRDFLAWGDQDSIPPAPDLVPPSASTNLEVN